MQVSTTSDNNVIYTFTEEEQKYLMEQHIWYLLLSKLTYKETVKVE